MTIFKEIDANLAKLQRDLKEIGLINRYSVAEHLSPAIDRMIEKENPASKTGEAATEFAGNGAGLNFAHTTGAVAHSKNSFLSIKITPPAAASFPLCKFGPGGDYVKDYTPTTKTARGVTLSVLNFLGRLLTTAHRLGGFRGKK